MADLTASGVVIERSWTEGGLNGKDLSARQVTLTLVAQGSNAGGSLIPASVLGLTKIEQATDFINSANTLVYTATPNYAGTALLLVDLTQAVDASRIPANITGTLRGVVKGYL